MSKPMDKIFREKLGRYKAPVKQDLWAAIAADQAAKRRKAQWRKAGLYGGSLLLLLSIGVFIYFTDDAYTSTTTVETSSTITPDIEASHTTASTAETSNDFSPIDEKQITLPSSSTDKPVTSNTSIAVTNSPDEKATSVDTNNKTYPSTNSNPTTALNTAEEPTTLPNNSKETTSTPLPINNRSSSIVTSIPNLPLPLLSPRTPELPKLEVQTLQQQTGKFKSSPKKRFALDLLLGPAYANQQFNITNEENRELLYAREISEFPEVSIMAGLRVGYHLNGRWSLRSGLLYTQIRNQFEYEQVGNTPSDPTILIKSSNQIRLLEIPLLASYELPGRRFRLAINAGPVINLSTTANGRYLLPDLMEPIKLKEDNIYQSNIGISYQASFTAAYDLGMGNSLLIEPTFRTYRSSFTQDSYALDERYWLFGLQFGLRHRLR